MTQDSTVVVHIYDDMVQAEVAREKLRANGIESYLENENVMGLDPIGGVEVKVFSRDKAEAERILTA